MRVRLKWQAVEAENSTCAMSCGGLQEKFRFEALRGDDWLRVEVA